MLSYGEFARYSPEEGWLGKEAPTRFFTHPFHEAASRIAASGMSGGVVVEGGPHTLWWSTQRPDGGRGLAGLDIAPPSLLRALQPRARLIVIVAEPCARMYSDYVFLGATGVVTSAREAAARTPSLFHAIVRTKDQG